MSDGLGLTVALTIGAAVYLGVAWYVFRHRLAAGGRALTVLLLAAGVWTIANAVEVSMDSPTDQEAWGDIKYVGIVLLPPALLTFAIEYTGRRRRVSREAAAWLLIEPIVVLTVLAVPSTHDLVRSVPADAPSGMYYVADVGPLFAVHAVYSYVVLLAGIGVLVVGLVRAARQHAVRSWVLIAFCLAPLVANAIFNFELLDLTLDPSPLAFSLAGFALVWGFFRFRLHELVPVGRRQVVDRIPDAVLVLDLNGRVMDANPAAGRLTGLAPSALTGRDLGDVLPQLRSAADQAPADADFALSCRGRADDGADLDLAVTLSPLPDDVSAPTGRLVVLRDITAQRDVERRLRELVRERSVTIETLRRGLYPVRMPAIPGLQVAAVLDPAEAETSIGGDFVDVRPSGPNRWTMMVGDVVGKGAGAATLTALARHTTVALTALGWTPARVLHEVSRAIAIDEQAAGNELEARFCTMALATLEPVDGGAKVGLALGGHPRPMLVTGAGLVREVGVPGSLLGVLPEPEIHDVTLRLEPGDSLVMFTDGVTESRNAGDAYGEARLADLLSQLAGLPAALVVREVVDAVRSFGTDTDPRDDVAVLVLSLPAEGVAGPLRPPGL
jgi:PAS domain S-box-containing protein